MNILDKAIASNFRDAGGWTLGQLTDALANVSPEYEYDGKMNQRSVVFDFCWAVPTHLISWRGVNAFLSLSWSIDYDAGLCVADLLAALKGADGTKFYGYKGGDYTMTRETPLWVAQTGETGNTIVCGLHIPDGIGDAVILTKWAEVV